MNTMSDHIRIVVRKWIEAGAPMVPVVVERFKWPTAAYMQQSEYMLLKDTAKRRRVSIAHAIRIAMEWYHTA
jgi:ABC-type proline/glycine betaine transport system substrate-binding protein